MSLWLQRRTIWYDTKDTPTYAKKRDSDGGCCWFGAISAGLCLSCTSVCLVLGRVSGDSHTGPLIWKSLSQVFHCQQGRSKCACWQSRPHSAASDQLHAMWHAEWSEYRNLAHRNLLFATSVATHGFIAWIVASDLDVLLANEHICSLSAPKYLKVL